MLVENTDSRPNNKENRLRAVGTAMEIVGTGAGLAGGFGSKLEVAGAGGVVFSVGYGINRLVDRVERQKRS
jgi:hypothetical protein